MSKILKNKFIIYKASGGFVHMISGFMYCMKMAINSGRSLIIDFKCNPAFEKNFSEYFEIYLPNLDKKIEIHESYDVIPKEYLLFQNLTLEILKKKLRLVDNKYTLFQTGIIIDPNIDIENNQQNIIINCGPKPFVGYKEYYFKVKKDIVNNIINSYPTINEPYISLQFRNTDKKNDIDHFIQILNKTIDETKIKTIYLATDDASAYDIFTSKLSKDLQILQYTKPFNNGGKNIHYGDKNKERMINNTLLDMIIILKSNYFIPSRNSGYSKFLMHMIDNNNNIFDINSKTKII